MCGYSSTESETELESKARKQLTLEIFRSNNGKGTGVWKINVGDVSDRLKVIQEKIKTLGVRCDADTLFMLEADTAVTSKNCKGCGANINTKDTEWEYLVSVLCKNCWTLHNSYVDNLLEGIDLP